MKKLPAVLVGAAVVLAVAGLPARARAENGGTPARSVWIAPTYQVLFTDVFERSSRHGVGAGLSYEFHISPTFNLGLSLAYRLYPGDRATQQLGYGTILKHFFSPRWSSEDGVYPYLDYGLLLQQTFVQGRTGNAVSHDTRLGGGALIRSGGVPFFVGLAAHYSRIDYFDIESQWVPYLDVQLGWVHAF
jgi:hypothetical protein